MAAAGISRALPVVEGMAVLGSSRSATWSEPCFVDLAAERVSGLASCAGLGFCAGRLPRLPSSSSSVAAVSAHVLLLRRRRNRESVRGNCARRAFVLDPLGRDSRRGGGGGAAAESPLRSKRVVLGVRSAGQFNTVAAETIVVSSPPKSPSSELSPPKSPLAAADISPPKSPPPPQETGGNDDDQSGPVEISGPINLDLEIDPFAFPEATPLQTAGSVFLTGTIAVLLLRSLRRRTRNAKRKRFRSDRTVDVGTENPKNPSNTAGLAAATTKAAEALSPASASSAATASPPSVFGTFSGALVAAGIAYVLFKFTLVVEGGFAKKAISANYSVRNISITVRTIIAGICYLATFVFAANSIGLTLYAFQLLLGRNPSDVEGEEGSNKEGGGSSLQGQGRNTVEGSNKEGRGSSLQGRNNNTLEEAGSDQQSNAKNTKSGDDSQSLGE